MAAKEFKQKTNEEASTNVILILFSLLSVRSYLVVAILVKLSK